MKVCVDLVPGKDPKKELSREDNGNYILSIQPDKKGKISFTIETDPSPKDNPSIFSFEIAIVDITDFTEVGIVKKAKVGTNKRAYRRMSVNIPNSMFEDGEYMLRVRALDENGIVLDTKKEFKEERVQAAWIDAKEQNKNLQIEQYRLEKHVAYCNESDVFTIDNTGDTVETEGTVDKRSKVSSITQAIIHYRSAHLAKGEELEIDYSGSDRNLWVEGNLNDTYQFDFGPAYAYQIQLPKKLIQLERAFLENDSDFGYVEAFLSGNPTDTTLLNPHDTAILAPCFVPAQNIGISDELISHRQELFTIIKESVSEERGLICTLDLTTNIGLIKSYLSEYDCWLREQSDKQLEEKEVIAIQNIDTVLLVVEMPDGTKKNMKLISPLHPLRLGWLVNLYELYQDWEEKTISNPKYKKAWYRKLDKLFQGQLPMEIAPLILSDTSLNEAYQYIGELTFGWGAYAKPSIGQQETFASSYRQLKSYTAMLMNVTRDKRIDSDVNLELVVRHLFNYSISHPYTDKLVINLFNTGDAAVFAQALVGLEKIGIGRDFTYEIRLFSDDNMLQPGESFKELLDPESMVAADAEVFSQASVNRLFPKLRFSLNKVSDFINEHDKYQAHLSFLVNPFAVHTELVRPDELSRSFYLNGTICRNVVNTSEEGNSFVWNRYFSNKTLPNPVTEFANTEVSIFARIQETVGNLLSSTLEESVPATTLRLKENDMMLLSFVHNCSDWVITFEKNMGPEFYDLPCSEDSDIPYLLDYVPGEETAGVSSYLTTKPTSEIGALMIPLFKEYGVDIENKENFRQILEDVRSVSSSLIMQINSTSRKAFEVMGTTLTKRFLEKKGIMKESFLIPIDLHKELFVDLDSDNKVRADNLVAKIDNERKEILFTVVEIKCRNASYQVDDLHKKIVEQIENTIFALREHFEIAVDGQDRLDRELKVLELKSLLEFYIKRSMRYGCLDPEIAHNYMVFLSKLADGYTIRFKQLGVVFDFQQTERQKKDYYGDAVIYTMGRPVIEDVLDETSTLSTKKLEAMDEELINFFEPSFYTVENSKATAYKQDSEDKSSKKTDKQEKPDYEIIIPKNDESSNESTEQDVSDDIVLDEPSVENEDQSVSFEENESEVDTSVDVINDNKDEVVNIPNDVSKVSIVNVDQNTKEYEEPSCDVIIGKNDVSSQYGVLGKMVSNGRRIGIDLNECNTISLFGVQGAGKSYTIGSITEMVLRQFSKVNKLPAPLASVIFHYSDSMDYAPEFTSMVYPNNEAGQLAKLKAEYGIEAGCIKDVVLLAPESQVEARIAEYPDIEVHPIGFDSSELAVKDWMFLLGAMGNDSTYIKELKQIMKSCRNDMSLMNIRNGVANSDHMSTSQRSLAEQKLDFAEEYISDGNKLQQYLKPGRLIIVDLRDEFIEKEEALGLFVVMLNIFSSVLKVDGSAFNKFIVFDEAHKYMNNKELVGSITTAIREMRHKGVSIMIASQDPMSLPTEIIELSSIVVMHRFSSPSWVKHVQKAITPLQTLTATEMASLGSGEAYLWANKATDKSITQRPIKISIRPRVTKHGGDTIQALKE
ncbi:MAG: ATP-binding protein [Bacteroidales bacterium]